MGQRSARERRARIGVFTANAAVALALAPAVCAAAAFTGRAGVGIAIVGLLACYAYDLGEMRHSTLGTFALTCGVLAVTLFVQAATMTSQTWWALLLAVDLFALAVLMFLWGFLQHAWFYKEGAGWLRLAESLLFACGPTVATTVGAWGGAAAFGSDWLALSCCVCGTVAHFAMSHPMPTAFPPRASREQAATLSVLPRGVGALHAAQLFLLPTLVYCALYSPTLMQFDRACDVGMLLAVPALASFACRARQPLWWSGISDAAAQPLLTGVGALGVLAATVFVEYRVIMPTWASVLTVPRPAADVLLANTLVLTLLAFAVLHAGFSRLFAQGCLALASAGLVPLLDLPWALLLVLPAVLYCAVEFAVGRELKHYAACVVGGIGLAVWFGWRSFAFLTFHFQGTHLEGGPLSRGLSLGTLSMLLVAVASVGMLSPVLTMSAGSANHSRGRRHSDLVGSSRVSSAGKPVANRLVSGATRALLGSLLVVQACGLLMIEGTLYGAPVPSPEPDAPPMYRWWLVLATSAFGLFLVWRLFSWGYVGRVATFAVAVLNVAKLALLNPVWHVHHNRHHGDLGEFGAAWGEHWGIPVPPAAFALAAALVSPLLVTPWARTPRRASTSSMNDWLKPVLYVVIVGRFLLWGRRRVLRSALRVLLSRYVSNELTWGVTMLLFSSTMAVAWRRAMPGHAASLRWSAVAVCTSVIFLVVQPSATDTSGRGVAAGGMSMGRWLLFLALALPLPLLLTLGGADGARPVAATLRARLGGAHAARRHVPAHVHTLRVAGLSVSAALAVGIAAMAHLPRFATHRVASTSQHAIDEWVAQADAGMAMFMPLIYAAAAFNAALVASVAVLTPTAARVAARRQQSASAASAVGVSAHVLLVRLAPQAYAALVVMLPSIMIAQHAAYSGAHSSLQEREATTVLLACFAAMHSIVALAARVGVVKEPRGAPGSSWVVTAGNISAAHAYVLAVVTNAFLLNGSVLGAVGLCPLLLLWHPHAARGGKRDALSSYWAVVTGLSATLLAATACHIFAWGPAVAHGLLAPPVDAVGVSAAFGLASTTFGPWKNALLMLSCVPLHAVVVRYLAVPTPSAARGIAAWAPPCLVALVWGDIVPLRLCGALGLVGGAAVFYVARRRRRAGQRAL